MSYCQMNKPHRSRTRFYFFRRDGPDRSGPVFNNHGNRTAHWPPIHLPTPRPALSLSLSLKKTLPVLTTRALTFDLPLILANGAGGAFENADPCSSGNPCLPPTILVSRLLLELIMRAQFTSHVDPKLDSFLLTPFSFSANHESAAFGSRACALILVLAELS